MLKKNMFDLRVATDVLNNDSFFIVADDRFKICRFKQTDDGRWQVWYYTHKYTILRNTLDDVFCDAERHWLRYKDEIYAGSEKQGSDGDTH